jgi:hypothetical protein
VRYILTRSRAYLAGLNITVQDVRSTLRNNTIIMRHTGMDVRLLAHITPEIANRVKALHDELPGLLGRQKKLCIEKHLLFVMVCLGGLGDDDLTETLPTSLAQLQTRF